MGEHERYARAQSQASIRLGERPPGARLLLLRRAPVRVRDAMERDAELDSLLDGARRLALPFASCAAVAAAP